MALILALTAIPALAEGKTKLPKNSVKSKQIKNGQVKKADVERSQVQLRIVESCPAGQAIQAVDANGAVACEVDDLGGGGGAPSGPAGGDLTGTFPNPQIADLAVRMANLADYAVTTAKLDESAVTIPKLAFDPATQAELGDHASSADHDSRYFTKPQLSTSDGNPPNAGSNFVHWNILGGVPAGFADGADNTGNDWSLAGNAGTTTPGNFLGTTDNEAFELRVDLDRGLRLEPTASAPNLIGGSELNVVSPGATGATIAGGGGSGENWVSDSAGTVSGGRGNRAGDGGGTVTDRMHATVGGGVANTAGGDGATIGGGVESTANGSRATVGGGGLNTANASSATVAGGGSNAASANAAAVGGGLSNVASATGATVAGGGSNTASGADSTVAGGGSNTASGVGATVGGGNFNLAAGDRSFVAGRAAQNTAAHDGAFVFADNSNVSFPSTVANEFAARATGGVRFVSGITAGGAPNAGVTLAPGGGSWTSISDRNAKRAFDSVDPSQILARLAQLPISTWSYEAQDSDIRHIGPMAQDFAKAFGVGEDPRGITSVDADGVALAAIQGLNEKVEASERRIEKLEAQLRRLR